MKKRLILTLILVLMASNAAVKTVSAMEIDENGARWWSIPELVDMSNETESRLVEYCGDDFECRMSLKFNWMDEDKKYWAIDVLDGFKFNITGLNLETGEIKVFLNKKDLSPEGIGIENKWAEIEAASISWLDKGADWTEYLEYIWNGKEMINGLHVLYTYNEGDDFLDRGETTLQVDLDLNENYTKVIQYMMRDEDGMEIIGAIDYANCVSSTDYVEGMECKMMISEDMRIDFMPFEVEKEGRDEIDGVVADDVVEVGIDRNDSDVDTDKGTINATDVAVVDNMPLTAEKTENNTEINQKEKLYEYSQNKEMVEAQPNFEEAQSHNQKMEDLEEKIEVPNLGGACEQKMDFPWWFLVILTILDVILAWLWGPKGEKR